MSLEELLMEMDSQNQDSETAAGMNAAQKEAATTAAQKETATMDYENKGLGDAKKAPATCLDGNPGCVLLLSRYFVLMREEDIGEFRDKLRKVVR